MKMASVYDTANHEAFYHGLLLGMTTLLVPEYEVKSNQEADWAGTTWPFIRLRRGSVASFWNSRRQTLHMSCWKRRRKPAVRLMKKAMIQISRPGALRTYGNTALPFMENGLP